MVLDMRMDSSIILLYYAYTVAEALKSDNGFLTGHFTRFNVTAPGEEGHMDNCPVKFSLLEHLFTTDFLSLFRDPTECELFLL
jgi:hypothetical protein